MLCRLCLGCTQQRVSGAPQQEACHVHGVMHMLAGFETSVKGGSELHVQWNRGGLGVLVGV